MEKKNIKEYREKRNFEKTPEPKNNENGENIFVVQKHQASHLHYDFRLEFEGVLKSWAIPKGPSMEPKEKRLAIQTEDHPLSYNGFEGVIPEGEYGAGKVIVWDNGKYEAINDMEKGFEEGEIEFRLEGEKLKGGFALIKMEGEKWLLIKKKDRFAGEKIKDEKSVKSGKKVEELG